VTDVPIFEITENIDDTKLVIEHAGVVRIARSVEFIRVKAIIVQGGFIDFNGDAGSQKIKIGKLSVSDPRDNQGRPFDAIHLGGVTGTIGKVIGTGLQQDLGKIGQGTRKLVIGSSVSQHVAIEWTPEPGHPPHQDGWQIMWAKDVTLGDMTFVGGPNTNHAAWYCQPNKSSSDIDPTDPTLVVNCVVQGGTIITKATGIALGACTHCGAMDMHIEAHYPFIAKKGRAIDAVNVDNELVEVDSSVEPMAL